MITAAALIRRALTARLREREAAAAEAPLTALSAAARADPCVLSVEAFGLEPWSRQRDVLAAVRDHDRVTVRSGHKVSKSTSAAILAWWWCSDPEARPAARAICTAPTARQVDEVIWREVTGLHARARRRGVVLPPPALDPGTGVSWPDQRQIVGFTVSERKPEAIAGFSGAHILFIIDEASGVDERIFETIDGNAAGGVKIVFFSNPTRTSGAFYRSHTARRSPFAAARIHIDSRESPNVTGEASVPGLATRAWVDELAEKYGADSLVFAVRVAGEFPTEGADSIYGPSLVRGAMARAAAGEGRLVIGVDVARFGDDTTRAALRRGQRVSAVEQLAKGDGPRTAVQILRLAAANRRPGERPRVHLDAAGVGAAVYDALSLDVLEVDGERWEPRAVVDVLPVEAGAAAADDAEFANCRAEYHFALRDWLRAGGSLPDLEDLAEDLGAIRYQLDEHNRLQVELKARIKARLGRSPDAGESVMLAVYEPPSTSAARVTF